jgi:hypothetical protein
LICTQDASTACQLHLGRTRLATRPFPNSVSQGMLPCWVLLRRYSRHLCILRAHLVLEELVEGGLHLRRVRPPSPVAGQVVGVGNNLGGVEKKALGEQQRSWHSQLNLL